MLLDHLLKLCLVDCVVVKCDIVYMCDVWVFVDTKDIRCYCVFVCFFQAEDGIRYLVRSRGLGDVYKRQGPENPQIEYAQSFERQLTLDRVSCRRLGFPWLPWRGPCHRVVLAQAWSCLLYTSDAADERSSVDLGGRRIIKHKTTTHKRCDHVYKRKT